LAAAGCLQQFYLIGIHRISLQINFLKNAGQFQRAFTYFDLSIGNIRNQV
jgi:hypothetical protein